MASKQYRKKVFGHSKAFDYVLQQNTTGYLRKLIMADFEQYKTQPEENRQVRKETKKPVKRILKKKEVFGPSNTMDYMLQMGNPSTYMRLLVLEDFYEHNNREKY